MTKKQLHRSLIRYRDLRNIVQNGLGINRNRIYDNENPYEIIEKSYKKLGIDMNVVNEKNAGNDKYGPKWFNEITNEYIQLDMYGYQEDKVNIYGKSRKETFKNTTEDAFHAAFATICNFYVINDNKSYKKIKQIYEKLGINTLVIKPVEFVEYYKKYISVNDDFQYILIIPEIIEKVKYVEEEIENGMLRTYYLPYHLFDFFNKIITITSSVHSLLIVLCRIRPTNGGLHVFEITNLGNRLIALFGLDTDGFGEIKEEELGVPEWKGRRWQIGKMNYRLTDINGYIQLYLEIKHDISL